MEAITNLLSAQSLLLAAITALTALWSDQLDAAREERPKGQHYQDNAKAHSRLKRTLWWRATPLLAYSAALALVLVPPSAQLLRTVYGYWFGEHHYAKFDPIAASLLLVHTGLILLACHLGVVWCDIYSRHKAFRQLT